MSTMLKTVADAQLIASLETNVKAMALNNAAEKIVDKVLEIIENSYPIRTDLALESQERLQEDQADMRGIRVLEERREDGVIVSTVMIETENASVAMGRPKGTYITIKTA